MSNILANVKKKYIILYNLSNDRFKHVLYIIRNYWSKRYFKIRSSKFANMNRMSFTNSGTIRSFEQNSSNFHKQNAILIRVFRSFDNIVSIR